MKKARAVLIVFAALFLVFFAISFLDFSRGEPQWGVSFSDLYAKALGLDPRATYDAILKDLEPKHLRLVAYWNRLEREKGRPDFSDLDWQVRGAERAGADVVLVLGYRTPRWPECHIPEWAVPLTEQEFEGAVLGQVKAVVDHYKSSPAVIAWQVENEPTLSSFGHCPKFNMELLHKELALVRSLDPRPVMVTDSGELSTWWGTAGMSDLLGTTLYRLVWSERLHLWWKHRYPPAFYTLRAALVTMLSKTKKVMISELQAEPWARGGVIAEVPFDEQTQHFDVNEFRENAAFAKKTGIRDIYLWGAEWWYWRKTKGDPRFWEFGKELFSPAGRSG